MTRKASLDIDFICHFKKYLTCNFQLTLNGYPKIVKAILVASEYQSFPLSVFTEQCTEDQYNIYNLSGDFLLENRLENFSPYLDIFFEDKNSVRVSNANIMRIINSKNAFKKLEKRFFDFINRENTPSILELGSRIRDAQDRDARFSSVKYTGLDLMQGKNVDVVSDIHEMSNNLPISCFDAIYCKYVFEHLAQPWVAAQEMNKVMKVGGHIYILTHQTYGVHHAPNDYWRVSNDAFKSVFNADTGFSIVETCISNPAFITPYYYSNAWQDCETLKGYIYSAAIIEKVSDVYSAHATNKAAKNYTNPTSYPL